MNDIVLQIPFESANFITLTLFQALENVVRAADQPAENATRRVIGKRDKDSSSFCHQDGQSFPFREEEECFCRPTAWHTRSIHDLSASCASVPTMAEIRRPLWGPQKDFERRLREESS